MRTTILTIALLCASAIGATASVLGIFENTNFPVAISAERDGVHRLEVVDDELYAATEKGIYKYSESANSWSCWAMENVNVLDFKVDGDNIVAITVPENQNGFRAIQVARLVRLNRNNGMTEDIIDARMGYFYYEHFLTYVMRIAQHPTNPRTLMVASYPGIWISEDFGTTWNFKFEWLFGYNENQFLGWHPTQNNVMFYTSESGIFAAQILRSDDNGENWDIINPDNNGDNSCHHLAFDPKDSDHILYSGEGCIFESTDCGKTWNCVYRQDYNKETEIGYAYNVMFDPKNNNTVYAVGCSSLNQDIHIFKSSDNGKTWEHIAKSDLFDNHEYWVHESLLFNGKIYIYTHSGVLSYNPGGDSGISNTMVENESSTTAVYDLSGRNVTNPIPGNIYIRDGKKVIQPTH